MFIYQNSRIKILFWELLSLNSKKRFENRYASVLPGYHQNKEHWNTVILDGTVPTDEIKRMIAESYDLVARK